jgi:LysM domain
MRGALLDPKGFEKGYVAGCGETSGERFEAAALVAPAPPAPPAPVRRSGRGGQAGSRRPGPARPAGEPLRYRGTGVTMTLAQGPHHRRSDHRLPVTVSTTLALALLAALITAWLGVLAHLSDAARDTSTPPLDRLAVVRVQSGETLPRLAARIAPGAPVDRVVKQIRDLNELDSAALEAGRTLIAPVG